MSTKPSSTADLLRQQLAREHREEAALAAHLQCIEKAKELAKEGAPAPALSPADLAEWQRKVARVQAAGQGKEPIAALRKALAAAAEEPARRAAALALAQRLGELKAQSAMVEAARLYAREAWLPGEGHAPAALALARRLSSAADAAGAAAGAGAADQAAAAPELALQAASLYARLDGALPALAPAPEDFVALRGLLHWLQPSRQGKAAMASQLRWLGRTPPPEGQALEGRAAVLCALRWLGRLEGCGEAGEEQEAPVDAATAPLPALQRCRSCAGARTLHATLHLAQRAAARATLPSQHCALHALRAALESGACSAAEALGAVLARSAVLHSIGRAEEARREQWEALRSWLCGSSSSGSGPGGLSSSGTTSTTPTHAYYLALLAARVETLGLPQGVEAEEQAEALRAGAAVASLVQGTLPLELQQRLPRLAALPPPFTHWRASEQGVTLLL